MWAQACHVQGPRGGEDSLRIILGYIRHRAVWESTIRRNMTRVLPASSTMNAELSVCLIQHHVMKTYQEATIHLQAFLISTSDESGQFHAPFVVRPRKGSSVTTRYGAGWVLEPV